MVKICKWDRKKGYWGIKWKNEDFDYLVINIIQLLKFDYAELCTFKGEIPRQIDYISINESEQFMYMTIDYNNSLKKLTTELLENLRFFELYLSLNDVIIAIFSSDNYGEFTSIDICKKYTRSEVEDLLKKIK